MKNASLSNAAKTSQTVDARVTAHLFLARLTARRCALIFGPLVEMDDLAQEASLALVRAAHLYKDGSRASFATYAQGACWRACLAAMRLALRRRDAIPRCDFDRPEDIVAPGASPFEGAMGLELWARGSRVLTDTERRILHARFRQGMTLRQIASLRGVTAGRINHIELKALAKLGYGAGVPSVELQI